jgi:small subunit ribosomal protein S18
MTTEPTAPEATSDPDGPLAEPAREPRAERPERADRGEREDRGDGRRRTGARRRGCEFCIDKIEVPDYKDVALMRRYVTDRGKLDPRRKAGTCAKHQRRVAVAVKRARHIALLPYTAEHVRVSGVFAGRPASTGGRR